MIYFFIIAASVSLAAYTYSQILTLEGMLLNWLYNYADRHWPRWLAYPAIVCFKCVAGQFSFWYYLYRVARYSEGRLVFPGYQWDAHILFVCLAIFLSFFYNKIFKWLTMK